MSKDNAGYEAERPPISLLSLTPVQAPSIDKPITLELCRDGFDLEDALPTKQQGFRESESSRPLSLKEVAQPFDVPPAERDSLSSSSHSERIDFKVIDFSEARGVLESESLGQSNGTAAVPRELWKQFRRREVPTDRALTERALEWLLMLPPTLRPHSLSSEFPRITNALAEAWPDPKRCQAELHELLVDTRKGRRGFPLAVQQELAALRSRLAEGEASRPEPLA